VQAYVDNLKATGQCEDGCIIGLDGTAWTGGLAVTAEEGAAIVAGFDDASGLRASGIMIAGKKFMYLRNDEEMMVGKAGQGGICIFKTGQALIMGTYNQDMAAAMNTKEVGKMAVRVPTCPAVQTDLAANFTDLDSCPPVPLCRSLLPVWFFSQDYLKEVGY